MALLTMSNKELNRLEIVQSAAEKRLLQTDAAHLLGISLRQFQRLIAKFKKYGPEGLTSQKRGVTSNRKLPASITERALKLIQSKYHDFGPTLATEKLAELHGLSISRETVRQLMIKHGLWLTWHDQDKARRERVKVQDF